jgi:hypothetical protein
MSHFVTDPSHDHRRQVLAEAVVSAYIDEIARPARRQHRTAAAPSHRATAPKPAAARSRALTTRRRPLVAQLGA